MRHLFPIAALMLAACVSAPPPTPTMTLVSVPGATCTTADGEVYDLPASIPCARAGVTHIEVSCPGYATRRVGMVTGKPQPRLASLLLGDLVRGLVVGPLDRIEVVEGQALLELEPLASGSDVGGLPSPALVPAPNR